MKKYKLIPLIVAMLAGTALAHPETANLDDSLCKDAAAGTAKVTFIGDSLTWRPDGLYDSFKEIFDNSFGTSNAGYQSCSVWTGAVNGSPGWTQGIINQDVAPHWGLDGMWLARTPGTAAGFDMDVKQPTGWVHVVGQPGGATVSINGVSYDTNTPAQQVLSIPYAIPETANLRLQTNGDGQTVFLGLENSSGTGNVLNKVANGGWGAEQYVQRNWTFDEQLTLLDSNYYIVMLGINDIGTPPQQWGAEMRILCDRLEEATPNAKIILVATYNTGAAYQPLMNQLYQIVTERGYGYINLFEYGGNYQSYLDRGFLVDGIHFTNAGGNYVANFIFSRLMMPCNKIEVSNEIVVDDCEGC